MTTKMYIGGEWVSARGNAMRDVINPSTGAAL
jgi:acyl-CoA reductase-like NAD-dependent aldehyde dehydrogenase